MREIAGEIGLELIAGFYSTSHDEGIAHLSGDPKIPLLQTILNGSGAYEYARSDILIEGSEMSQLRETAKHIQSKFDAPNRDEQFAAPRGMTHYPHLKRNVQKRSWPLFLFACADNQQDGCFRNPASRG